MSLYYRNGTLYVEVNNDLNFETEALIERRIFKIIDDYGIDKVTIIVSGLIERNAVNEFKKKYYHKYKGYLIIK